MAAHRLTAAEARDAADDAEVLAEAFSTLIHIAERTRPHTAARTTLLDAADLLWPSLRPGPLGVID